MSDSSSAIQSGERAVLNWRGPLLAAAIFAVIFAILLLMAHQNQSNTTDEGSSLRQDPYGTSLLFDSYQRAGYQVERSEDENSLADQDASHTTAFFIGGFPFDLWQTDTGKSQTGTKSDSGLEDFVSRGGRVVLIEPGWGGALTFRNQGWRFEEQWSKAPHPSAPAWISPDPHAMPAGSEAMYLGSDSPWLKTDAHWAALYERPASAADVGATKTTAGGDLAARVYMAMRQVGKGEVIAASQESFLLNEAIKTHPNPVLLDFLAGGRRVIWVDETLHGLHQDEGVLWLVKRYRLQVALLLFWASLLALLWSMSDDLVRRPARDRIAEIMSYGKDAGVAAQRVLQRSIATEQVVAECWEQFRRRSPQDAQAISADPHWSKRLRVALAAPPLAGYKELMRLIAERRASAKGLPRTDQDAPQTFPDSRKTNPEEVRTA
ncbi:MAG TPA: DUF4350 domain-containing protein [Candidatus Dormibacteraeota bacterium]|nr:DUF4350 domain-containing protein [Candidatus Dormibacteraeota bacterium]